MLQRKIRVEFPLTNGTAKQSIKVSSIASTVLGYRIVGWRCEPGIFPVKGTSLGIGLGTSGTSLTYTHTQPTGKIFSETQIIEFVKNAIEDSFRQHPSFNGTDFISAEFARGGGIASFFIDNATTSLLFALPGDSTSNPITEGIGISYSSGPVFSNRSSTDTSSSVQPFPYTFKVYCPQLQSRTVVGGTVGTTTSFDLGYASVVQTPLITVIRNPEKTVVVNNSVDSYIEMSPNFQPQQGLDFIIEPLTPFPTYANDAEFTFPNIFIIIEFLVR